MLGNMGKKTDFLSRISTSLFTLGAGIEPLRAGWTWPLFFINHSMPVSIHPSIRGPCKNTRAPQAPRLRPYVQQQHDAAGTDTFLPFPWIGVWKFVSGQKKSETPTKKEERCKRKKVVRPVKNAERWAGILEMWRGERNGEDASGRGASGNGEGEEGRPQGAVPPAGDTFASVFKYHINCVFNNPRWVRARRRPETTIAQ